MEVTETPLNVPVDELAIKVPPQDPAYNSHCAPAPKDPPFTVKSTVPPGEHIVLVDAVRLPGLVELFSTVTVTVFEKKSPHAEDIFLLKHVVCVIDPGK